MKFLNISNQSEISAAGTSLVNYVEIGYDKLVEIFGEPTRDTDGYKVDAEWLLLFEDGTLATIYNYKDGKNYCGDEGDEVEDITEWHVGGKGQEALDRVLEAIKEAEDAEKDALASLKFPRDNYRVILIDASKTGVHKVDELKPMAVLPVDPFLQSNVKKEICEYENAKDQDQSKNNS